VSVIGGIIAYFVIAGILATIVARVTGDSLGAALMISWPLTLPAILFSAFADWLCD
jgi:hypothetical protein